MFVVAWKLVVVVGNYPAVHPARRRSGRRAASCGRGRRHDRAARAGDAGRRSCWGFVGRRTSGALSIGYLLARSALAERLLSPYLVAAQATPILALAPLLVLWFGTGLLSKVVICALIVFFPVAVATMVGIRSVDARLLELGRSLRATRWQVFRHLELPAALPRSWAACASA